MDNLDWLKSYNFKNDSFLSDIRWNYSRAVWCSSSDFSVSKSPAMLYFELFLISVLSVTINCYRFCIKYYDVYDMCKNPFPSGCCSLGSAFVCNEVRLTHTSDFADEIPKVTESLTIANTNNSFINAGDWKFLSNLTNLKELSFYNSKISILEDLKPVYVKNLSKLKRLSLSYGELQIFPAGELKNLVSLQYLDLNCNH